MKLTYAPDTKENRLKHIELIASEYAFGSRMKNKAIAAINKGNAVSVQLNLDKKKVISITIIENPT